MHLGVFRAIVYPLAFGAKPEALRIPTYPSFEIPARRASRIGVPPLQLIGEHEGANSLVVYGMAAQLRKCGCAVAIGNGWETRILLWPNVRRRLRRIRSLRRVGRRRLMRRVIPSRCSKARKNEDTGHEGGHGRPHAPFSSTLT